jgi:plastocyanin
VAALAAALLVPGTATAATATVTVTDNHFSNASPTLALGGTVNWQRSTGTNPHTTTSDKFGGTAAGWDMNIPAGTTPTADVTFDRAGGFAFHCKFHAMRGTVMVQMSPSDSTPQINQTITITFALSAAPSGFSEQIQKRKLGGTWRNFSAANTGTTVTWKPAKAKTFQFRARLVNGGNMSNWSPILQLTVSP